MVDRAAGAHFIIHFVEVLLELCGFYLSGNLLGCPGLERQGTWGVLQSAMSLDIFVSNDRLHGGIRVVDQQLVDCLQWHFILVLVII